MKAHRTIMLALSTGCLITQKKLSDVDALNSLINALVLWCPPPPPTPEFIWIKILKRPQCTNLDKVFNMRRKFNSILENTLYNRKGYISHYILSIEVEQNEILPTGALSNDGKHRFWREVDSCIQKFKSRKINLKPKSNKKHNKKDLKLPTPRPSRGSGDSKQCHRNLHRQ